MRGEVEGARRALVCCVRSVARVDDVMCVLVLSSLLLRCGACTVDAPRPCAACDARGMGACAAALAGRCWAALMPVGVSAADIAKRAVADARWTVLCSST